MGGEGSCGVRFVLFVVLFFQEQVCLGFCDSRFVCLG